VSWSFREAAWSFGHLLLVLCGPAILFVCGTTLVPSESRRDWRAHDYGIHRWLFLTLLFFLLQTTWMIWSPGGPFLLIPTRPVWPLIGLATLAAAASEHTAVHATVSLASILVLLYVSLDPLRPGAAL